MMEWKFCGFCGERKEAIFDIEFWTQHCSPTRQYALVICDSCLDEKGIKVDNIIHCAESVPA